MTPWELYSSITDLYIFYQRIGTPNKSIKCYAYFSRSLLRNIFLKASVRYHHTICFSVRTHTIHVQRPHRLTFPHRNRFWLTDFRFAPVCLYIDGLFVKKCKKIEQNVKDSWFWPSCIAGILKCFTHPYIIYPMIEITLDFCITRHVKDNLIHSFMMMPTLKICRVMKHHNS